MGLFDFIKKKPGEAGVPTPPAGAVPAADPTTAGAEPSGAASSAPPQFVEVQDGFGRRMRMSREDYRKKHLPELLKQHGSDAERLTAVILQGLRDGFAEDLVAAANRLTIVDKEPERALSVLAVVQRDAGDLDGSAATLQELLAKRPQSPGARVGLALLADQRGDAARAEALLREALAIDPNHADAVHGLLAIRHRTVGEAGYRAELEALAALGGWRGKLWLARWLLQNGEGATAAPIYREVLSGEDVESDALVMAGADLVQAGQHELVQELVVPRFVPGRHHPHIGLAILHHYLQTEQHVPGSELLHQMYLHYGHLVAEALHPFTAGFDRQRLATLPPPAPMPASPRLGLYRFDRPLWCAGLADPLWLLPPKTNDARQVLCFALAVEGQQQLPAGQEDEIGRVTRAVPLFLAEHVWLSTPHRGTAGLLMAEQGGWVVLGKVWPEEQLVAQLSAEEKERTIAVSGVLRIDGDKRRIDLWAYDCNTQQRVGHAAAEGAPGELGRMLLQLLAELWPALGGPAGHQPPVGSEGSWQAYADGLAQHAALVATQAGGMPKERLYGERYILQWLQNTALLEPRWQPGFWLLASAMCVLRGLGSPVPKEFARAVAEIFRQSPPNSAFARLGVLPLRAAGLDGVWQARRAEIVQANSGDANFTAWLARAEAAR
ncbi:MAG: tetratricopeptide repeat protein [Planctomycetes bacterium]|nr:tetratricopeptide repeat protein [Planctomycetota bacterium]